MLMKRNKSNGNIRKTVAFLLAAALLVNGSVSMDAQAAKDKLGQGIGSTSVDIVQPQVNNLHLEYSFGEPSFEAASYGYQVLLDDATGINALGMPDLPAKTVSFLLPKGKTVKSVKVNGDTTKTYRNILIAPATALAKVTNIDNTNDDPDASDEGQTVSDNTADMQENTYGEETYSESDLADSEAEETAVETGLESDPEIGINTEETVLSEEQTGTETQEEQADVAAEELDNASKSRISEETDVIVDGILKKDFDFSESDLFNTSVYSGLATYPASKYAEGSVQTIRGFSIYTITLYPMTYSGTTLSYSQDMSLDVTFASDNKETEYVPTEADLEFLGDDVDVSQFKDTYFNTAAETETGKTIAGDGQIDYIIITSNSLAKTFRKLADYKESKGLRTAVVTTDKIYKNYKGYDKAEKIRNFIKDAYTKNRVTYVLLGGDGDNKANSKTAVVPTRMLYCKAVAQGEKPTYIASDLYYSCLDGTYDNNKNHKYGEKKDGVGGKDVDLMADVYVGRAPVDNKKEAQNFVTKTINYETRKKSAKALMIGEQLDGNISCSVELASQLQDEIDARTLEDTIRRLRDEKIKPEYVELYYDANSFVKAVYLDNLGLLGETVSLLTEYQPIVEEYLKNGTTSQKLTASDIKCLCNYCDEFSAAIANSSRNYADKQTLIKEVNRFGKYLQSCEGQTYSDMFENSHICKDKTDTIDTAAYKKLDAVYGGTYKEEIRKGSKANNMKTRKIPSKYKVKTLYDKTSESGQWSTEELLKLLNASPEMINHLGHANIDSLMRLNVKQIKALSNKNAFFFYSQGCYDGSFDNCKPNGKYTKTDSIAEELLVSSAKSGAFACVVNSRYGWYNSDPSSTKGPSQIFDRLFWDQAMYGKDKSLGAILAKSRQNENVLSNLNDSTYGEVLRYCYYELNLLGDPETKLQDLKDPLLKQTTLTVERNSSESVLTWQKVSGASTYFVYRSESKNGAYTRLGSASGKSYTDATVEEGKTYYYKVAAYKKVSGRKYFRYSKPVASENQ